MVFDLFFYCVTVKTIYMQSVIQLTACTKNQLVREGSIAARPPGGTHTRKGWECLSEILNNNNNNNNNKLNPWRRPIWVWSKLPLTPDRDHVREQTNIYFYISLCTALNIRKFCPECPKWDQNQKFAPRSETRSIPGTSICKILNRHLNQHLIISTDTQSTQDWHSINI